MNLQEAADYIVEKMAKEGVAVHRYDAITSKSIYLKFDFGVAYSLRISDHKGYKHLTYRYNLMQGATGKRTQIDKGFKRDYYGLDWIDGMIRDILQNRKSKMQSEGAMYHHAVKAAMEDCRIKKTKFWAGATQITPYTVTSEQLSRAVQQRHSNLGWGMNWEAE